MVATPWRCLGPEWSRGTPEHRRRPGAPHLWPAQVLNAVPVILHIPGVAAKVFPGQKGFMALVDELLAEHKTTWDPTQPPRDLADAYLDEVEKVRGGCRDEAGICGLRAP